MRHAIVGLALLAAAATSAVALDGPGRALVVSNQIQLANNPALTGGPGSSVTRSFIPPYSGTVRLTWEIRSQEGANVEVDAFVEHLSNCSTDIVSSTSFVVQTCDIRVMAGMPVNVQAFPTSGTDVVTLRRVVLHYDVVDSNGKAIHWEVALPA
jgi:hypothetical protein